MPDRPICDKIGTKGRVVHMNLHEISDDAIIKGIARAILEDEQGVAVANRTREEEFVACEELVRKLFAGSGVKIRTEPHCDLPSMGCIEVIGKNIRILDPFRFGAAGSLAHNYEFYSKLDGTVVLSFTFYRMTVKV